MTAPHGRLTGRSALDACALVCLLALPASAQKTDVITLLNGDTFTCEIKLLDCGRLQASTDDLGTLNVEWQKVASVSAARTFRVETSTGARWFGQLTSSRPGFLAIATADGPIPVPVGEVVYLAPIGSRFWSRLDGSLDLGLSYTQSSGVAQLNFSTSTTFRRPSFQLTASAASYLTRQEEADDTSRHTVGFQGVRPFGNQWLWLAQGGFERNQELGYDLRSSVSSGFGRFLVRSNRALLVVGGGLSTNRELPTVGDSTQNLEGLFAARQSFFTYDYPKTDITTSVDVYPSLSQWGRYACSSTAGSSAKSCATSVSDSRSTTASTAGHPPPTLAGTTSVQSHPWLDFLDFKDHSNDYSPTSRPGGHLPSRRRRRGRRADRFE